LSASLAESHKENRTLKKEKSGLLREREDLLNMIEELNERLKEMSSHSKAAAVATSSLAANNEKRSSQSIREGQAENSRHRQQELVYEAAAPLPSAFLCIFLI